MYSHPNLFLMTLGNRVPFAQLEDSMTLKVAQYFLWRAENAKVAAESAATRERILSTATRMFLDKGLATVGMRDIMADCESSAGWVLSPFPIQGPTHCCSE